MPEDLAGGGNFFRHGDPKLEFSVRGGEGKERKEKGGGEREKRG